MGHIVAVVAWWRTANEETLDDQVGWASLAIIAFVLVAYANVTWLLRARFAIVQRRESLLPTEAPTGLDPEAAYDVALVVAGPGLDRYHLASCPLASGRTWPALARRAIEGRAPCGICQP